MVPNQHCNKKKKLEKYCINNNTLETEPNQNRKGVACTG